MRNISWSCFLFVLLWSGAYGQEQKDKTFEFKGYVKDMASFNFPKNADSVITDNLIHNRLNFRWIPSSQFQVRVELRTRAFSGDRVQSFSDFKEWYSVDAYSDLIDVNNDFFDLSWVVFENDKLVIHTMLDRAYAEWKRDDWSLQIGRQRINWGINLAWNPNDIFNAYSFFDFDYEERPGSDAIRFQKYKGYAGGYEIAVKMADSLEALTAGFLYKWNKNNYDYQFLAGVMKNNIAIGTGWAGSLGTVGFKGEMTWFEPLGKDEKRSFIGALSADYLFSNSIYLNGSVLYNSKPVSTDIFSLSNTGNADIRTLLPFEWSMFLQTSYPVHPLVNMGLSAMVFPGAEGVFINPFITWGIVSNLDFDLIGQFYFTDSNSSVYVAYTRLKWSF
jgi:hypothetical protein